MPPATKGRGGSGSASVKDLVKSLPGESASRWRAGTELLVLVLSCNRDDTIAVDLASGALVRLRVPWPEEHEPDLTAFDVVQATLAADPERDDLASQRRQRWRGSPASRDPAGRRVRHMLQRLAAPPDGPLLGFPGPAAPYWDFRGLRPSAALIVPTRGPQLIRRTDDHSTWARFGWDRDDVWLPVEDAMAARALDAARTERLSGKTLATALGFAPRYLLVSVTARARATATRSAAPSCPRAENSSHAARSEPEREVNGRACPRRGPRPWPTRTPRGGHPCRGRQRRTTR